jgi:hypothetical protein
MVFAAGPHLDNYSEIIRLVGQATSVMLYVAAGYFFVRALLVLFTSQVDLIGGRPGALADMLQQMIFLLLSFVFALDAPRLLQGFVRLAASHMGDYTSGEIGGLVQVLEPVFLLLFNLLGTLAVASLMINLVYAALQAQISATLGASVGLSQAFVSLGSTILTFVLGIAILRLGSWAISFFIARL